MSVVKVSVDIKDIEKYKNFGISEIIENLYNAIKEIAKEFKNNELKNVKKGDIKSLKVCSDGKIEIKFEKK